MSDQVPDGAEPPSWLGGLQKGLVVVLLALPVLLVVAAIVSGSWWFAVAAVPSAGFVLALGQALTFRRLGYHMATEPDGGLQRSRPFYGRAAAWSLAALVLFVLSVVLLQAGAADLDDASASDVAAWPATVEPSVTAR
jgi:hypothetical protein